MQEIAYAVKRNTREVSPKQRSQPDPIRLKVKVISTPDSSIMELHTVSSHTSLFPPYLHRIGGPAVVRKDGNNRFWFLDECYNFPEYCELVRPYMTDEAYLIMILTYQ